MYLDKYLKYKTKYIALKMKAMHKPTHRLPPIKDIIACDNKVFLENKHGTCWNVAIDTIFLFGHLTSEDCQKRLYSIVRMKQLIMPHRDLLKCLPFIYFIDYDTSKDLAPLYRDTIYNIFINIQHSLDEATKSTHSVEKCQRNIGKLFYTLLNKSPNEEIDKIKYGASKTEQFLFILLMSVFLLQKQVFITYTSLYNGDLSLLINKRPTQNYPTNLIGIVVHFYHHASCLYICKSPPKPTYTYKYYNDNLHKIEGFNWLNFINIYSKLNRDSCKIYSFKKHSSKERFNRRYRDAYKNMIDSMNLENVNLFIIDIENYQMYTNIRRDFKLNGLSSKEVKTLYTIIQNHVSDEDNDESLHFFREVRNLTFLTLNNVSMQIQVNSPDQYITVHQHQYIKFYINYYFNNNFSSIELTRLYITQLDNIRINQGAALADYDIFIINKIISLMSIIHDRIDIRDKVIILLDLTRLNINLVSITGHVILYKAIELKLYDIIKKLISLSNIDITIVDRKGKTCIDYIDKVHDRNIYKIFLEYKLLNLSKNKLEA